MPVDVEFDVELHGSYPHCFAAEPANGRISGADGCEIAVKYSPVRFVTDTGRLVVR